MIILCRVIYDHHIIEDLTSSNLHPISLMTIYNFNLKTFYTYYNTKQLFKYHCNFYFVQIHYDVQYYTLSTRGFV